MKWSGKHMCRDHFLTSLIARCSRWAIGIARTLPLNHHLMLCDDLRHNRPHSGGVTDTKANPEGSAKTSAVCMGIEWKVLQAEGFVLVRKLVERRKIVSEDLVREKVVAVSTFSLGKCTTESPLLTRLFFVCYGSTFLAEWIRVMPSCRACVLCLLSCVLGQT
jgi:hypothetical protein